MRVVVVGAGIMGSATAIALAARGVRDVIVLERAVPGVEASSAAAGMLAAQIESHDAGERARYVRAREAYGAWTEELREATGVDSGHRRSGAVVLARSDGELDALARAVDEQTREGLRAELVRGADLIRLEPEIASTFAGAAYYPDEAQVDPPRLLRALVARTSRAGITVRSGTTVHGIVAEGGRARGVRLDGHELLEADAVVLAAGSWSSLVPGLPEGLPRVEPVRGQLALVEERPPRLSRIVFAGSAYLVPRGDGRVVCGATTEHVGHARGITAGGVHAILGDAIAIAPALSQAELVRTWSNFRPRSVTGAPLVGASPLPGLFLATGHYRNGILLAKTTADEVVDAIVAGAG